jgi:hypothetical protein
LGTTGAGTSRWEGRNEALSSERSRSGRWSLAPKMDVVFKLLFAAEKNRELLISLLTALLRPESPIESVEVLNPEIDKKGGAPRGRSWTSGPGSLTGAGPMWRCRLGGKAA